MDWDCAKGFSEMSEGLLRRGRQLTMSTGCGESHRAATWRELFKVRDNGCGNLTGGLEHKSLL